jgi:hypothetical protein
MKRIGIAASKISKGNVALYNFYVVLISFLFSLFIFIVAGSTVVFSLIIINYVGGELKAFEFEKGLRFILTICMGTLTAVITIFNLVAISTNMKIRKAKVK